MSQKPISVSYLMLRNIVLATILLGIAISGVQIFADYKNRLKTFESRAQEVMSSIENAAVKAVYTFDEDLALEVANGLMAFQPITSVEIIDENRHTMILMKKYVGDLPFTPLSHTLFEIQYSYQNQLFQRNIIDHQIGTLKVTASPHQMIADFFYSASALLISTLLQSFGIAAVILLLLHSQVTQPLQMLARRFDQIDPAEPEKNPLLLNKEKQPLEFQQVLTSGNHLLRIIGSQLREKDQAEQQILQQKKETERYLEIAEAIIVELDAFSQVLMINQRGLEVLGYMREEIITRNWLDLVIEDGQRQQIRALFFNILCTPLEALQHSNLTYFEGNILTKSGERRWISWHATIQIDHNGEASGLILSGQDLTKRKATEEALRDTENNLRAIIEATHEGFAIFDLNSFDLIDINSAWHFMIGYERDEMLNLGLVAFVPEDDQIDLQHALRKVRRENHIRFELRLKTKTGQILFAEANAARLPNEDNMPQKAVIFLTDITERKKQEEMQQHLENQLRQAQKLETLGTLAGGIAHDFNNILTPVLGYSSLLLSRLEKTDPNYERIEQISMAANRGKQMIRHILTFARRGEGEMDHIDILPVVREGLDLIRSTLPANIVLKLNIPEDPLTVFADGTQIQQVLLNLTNNACQAMPDGGTLEIGIQADQDPPLDQLVLPNVLVGRCVRIYVSDTGAGMDNETINRIFDPFFTTKGHGEGTGLGLAMVHGIVQNHQGNIRIDSLVGQGSRFDIYLQQRNTPAIVAKEETTPELGSSECILVLDDESVNTRFLEDFLNQTGYRTQCFTDAESALSAFMSTPEKFQAILTDQTMPHMTGEHFVQEIRKNDDDIPIIMMSGFDKDITEEKAMGFGVDIYMQKPVDIEQLASALKSLL